MKFAIIKLELYIKSTLKLSVVLLIWNFVINEMRVKLL